MTILTLQPDATAGIDTTIRQFSPTLNYGTTTSISAGWDASSSANRRGLLQFDLSSIPAGALVTSAILTLDCVSELNANDIAFNIHRSLVQWYEGSENGGAPGAGVDGSTWNLRNANGSLAWGAAGGTFGIDFAYSPTVATTVTGLGSFTWNVTVDVQNFVDGSLTNYGWWLLSSIESGATSGQKVFASSDDATPANRPKLEITYTVNSVLSLQPSGAAGIDTYLDEFGNPGGKSVFNYGATTAIHTGHDSAQNLGLIKFDLSSLPPSASILAAALVLHVGTATGTAAAVAVEFHRMLVQWFEGQENGAAPSGGRDGSTYVKRNAEGSVAWASGGAPGSGTDYAAGITASQTIAGAGGFFAWDVTVDVAAFYSGSAVNNGWLIYAGNAANTGKYFESSDSATTANRPKLVIVYSLNSPLVGTIAGTSTVTGILLAIGVLNGLALGTSTTTGFAYTNAIGGTMAGTSTVTGTMGAGTHMLGPAVGSSTTVGILKAKGFLIGAVSGVSTAIADGNFIGEMRGQSNGAASAIAHGIALSLHIVRARGCQIDPLFYITDGTIKDNGQLNWLNLIDNRIGFLLDDWKPNIAQYKGGGTFSDSPYGTGRRLVKRVFANAIEVLNIKCRGYDQDDLFWYTRQFFHFQEAAADFWTGNWADQPVYLVAKGPMETNIRYAIIHVMSAPELENPYAQTVNPSTGKPALESFMMRIERGDWMSSPPRNSECVAISSRRSWTIASWTS